ncbi:aminotransferase [Oceanibacterium hippocampi]|uniref:aspartate transaminase n=1 Tax=Oceanibacterium hippocampi TaxID=745714 RepID=A0A1Y5R808_9PROT|nr:aminotransferase [Oceanibacterium hippocampi]SLN11282.1 Aspartate aminotransferase [Oceanibacterium hippocampi]
MFAMNPMVAGAIEPPIAEADGWLDGLVPDPARPILPMAQAVPAYPPPDDLLDDLAARIRRPGSSRYTAITGVPDLRAALAGHMQDEYGGVLQAANVLISAGCNQAFCLAISALAGPGDEVILPLPYYFNHQMWLDMQGIVARYLPFRPDRGGVPDPAEAALLIGPRTRAIVLVTPNNPTGTVYPPEVIAAFRDIARARGIALVLDETYKDFREEGGVPAHHLFGDPEWGETVIQLYSFSKVYCLTGHRVGSIIADPTFIARAAKIMDTLAICAPHTGQIAALYGLRNLDAWREANRRTMAARLDRVRAIFADRPGGFELAGAGAYFAYVRHPWPGRPAAEVARDLVREARVHCLPGSMFGPGQEDYLRLAFANLGEAALAALPERLAFANAAPSMAGSGHV